MIKAVVFDLDGMVHHEPERFSNFYSDKFNVPIKNLSDFFVKEYTKCQIGELDLKKVLPKHFQKWQWSESVEDLLELWANFGTIDKDMIDLVNGLRNKNIICTLATNNEKYRFEKMNEKYRFDKIFDDIINSYKIKSLKPGDKFNQEIIRVAGCLPEEILVCDDKEKFIGVLKKYGFKTLLFKDIDQFKKELLSNGVNL